MNPFSTCHWTPGTIPFLTETGLFDLDCLAEQMAHLGPVQQIVGPHGSGKSTLLASLAKQLEKRNINVQSVMLTDGMRRLPNDFRPAKKSGADKQTIFFLDGYEQLSISRRLLLRQNGWHERARLIFTCHRPAWFVPILYETKPQWPIFLKIVNELTRETTSIDTKLIGEAELQMIYCESAQNFRTAFMSLYDYWEAK